MFVLKKFGLFLLFLFLVSPGFAEAAAAFASSEEEYRRTTIKYKGESHVYFSTNSEEEGVDIAKEYKEEEATVVFPGEGTSKRKGVHIANIGDRLFVVRPMTSDRTENFLRFLNSAIMNECGFGNFFPNVIMGLNLEGPYRPSLLFSEFISSGIEPHDLEGRLKGLIDSYGAVCLGDCPIDGGGISDLIDPDRIAEFRVAVGILAHRDMMKRNIMIRRGITPESKLSVVSIDNENHINGIFNHYKEPHYIRMGLPSSKYLPEDFLDRIRKWKPTEMFRTIPEIIESAVEAEIIIKNSIFYERVYKSLTVVKRFLVIVKTLADRSDKVETNSVIEVFRYLSKYLSYHAKGVLLSVAKPDGMDPRYFMGENPESVVSLSEIDEQEINGIKDLVPVI